MRPLPLAGGVPPAVEPPPIASVEPPRPFAAEPRSLSLAGSEWSCEVTFVADGGSATGASVHCVGPGAPVDAVGRCGELGALAMLDGATGPFQLTLRCGPDFGAPGR